MLFLVLIFALVLTIRRLTIGLQFRRLVLYGWGQYKETQQVKTKSLLLHFEKGEMKKVQRRNG